MVERICSCGTRNALMLIIMAFLFIHCPMLGAQTQPQYGTISNEYCQPYKSSTTTNPCSCTFTLCPKEVLSVDNCDPTCTHSTKSFSMEGSAHVRLFSENVNQLLQSSKVSSLKASNSICSHRQWCTSIENYELPSSFTSCQQVSLRELCSTNSTCMSMFRLRIWKPSSGGTSRSLLSQSNVTSWIDTSSTSAISNAPSDSCELLSFPSFQSTSKASAGNKSSLVLIAVLVLVGLFLLCSIYRYRSQKKQQLNNIHPQQGAQSSNKAWWFFKTNIIKPLLPLNIQPISTQPPAPFSPSSPNNQINNNNNINNNNLANVNSQSQNIANYRRPGPGPSTLPFAVPAPTLNNLDDVVSFHEELPGTITEPDSRMPVAVMLNQFTAPKTPPRPRVVEHARPYRSVILVPELGSPAIAVPATPSPWSPIY